MSAARTASHALFTLLRSEQGLALQMQAPNAPGPVMADFSNPRLTHRIQDAVQKQSIARAVGIRPGLRPTVIDATAGFGRDAFLLASLGCRVTLIEADALVHALLEDGLARARQRAAGSLLETLERMQLLQGDFCQLARQLDAAEVVYLDPMFPARNKTARAKKEMYVLQQYLSSCEPLQAETALLDAALQKAQRRVVVKRGRLSPRIDEREPAFALSGSSCRYDVYLRP